jgi:transposase InsO family protein
MSFTYQERIKVLEFYDKYGLNPALDFVRCQGVDISQATLYRWLGVRKKAKSSCGEISVSQSLTPKSTKPKTYRSSSYPSFYIQFIKLVRKKRFGIGKEKLAKMIELGRTDIVYAVELSLEYSGNSRDMNLFGLPPISPSTIGRIISSLKTQRAIPRNVKEYNKQKLVYLHGGTGMVKCRKLKDKSLLYGKKKKRRPEGYEASKVGDQVQLDAVTIQTNVLNPELGTTTTKKLYFVCAIDVVSRISYSKRYDTLNSKATADFLDKFKAKLAYYTRLNTQLNNNQNNEINIKVIQTDNGQENHKHFITKLNKEGITQWFNYPRSPKMNAFIEKYNHTVQAECLEYNLYLLRQGNYAEFDRRHQEWNTWYNSKRPHTSLQYLSPVQYFNQQLKV